ncbi:MAG: type II toxin-antitoxin system VapC family toxin [Anaerolineales bacterium]|nr:type II toxin-antitoxin system VapC family toxin [Anaerolineales bacterium]
MSFLLDTCVISEALAKKPNPKVVGFVDNLDPDDVYLSVITIGEYFKGIEKLPKSRRKSELQTWFEDELLIRYDENILPLDTRTLITWGTLTARLESDGYTMPAMDSLIAATALTYELVLVTRNVGDFEKSGVEIVNPWE